MAFILSQNIKINKTNSNKNQKIQKSIKRKEQYL